MEDIDMPDASPPGLFFAGSDDDEPPIARSAKSSSLPPSSSPHSHVLFLEDTDDDDAMYMSPKPSNLSEKAKRPIVIEEEDPDIQIMKHSQVSAKIESDQRSCPTSLSPTLDKKTLSPEPVAKKRRLLPPEHESSSNHATELSPIYLGEVVISNAWSNVSGKGYVKQNESVVVKREEQELPQAGTSKLKPTTVQSGKKKQISIATMLKPQPAKSAKKKKKDNIVRLVNNNGSGNHCSSSPESIR
jgi:DNA repair protein RAD5